MWDCARNKGVQAEASTLLHESSNSEPETIKQGEIVFHYIRVRVARVGVIPLVGTKPVAINRKHTHVYYSCIKTWLNDQELSSYLRRWKRKQRLVKHVQKWDIADQAFENQHALLWIPIKTDVAVLLIRVQY